MIRKAFVMSIYPGKEDEYRQRHEKIWPALSAELKEHGVHNYSIFILPHTAQLFAYVEVESEERWNSVAETTICKEWWSYMKDIMPANPDYSPVSFALSEVYHLP